MVKHQTVQQHTRHVPAVSLTLCSRLTSSVSLPAAAHQRVEEGVVEGAVALAGGEAAEDAHQADPVLGARRLQSVVDGQQAGHARLGDVRLVRVRRRTCGRAQPTHTVTTRRRMMTIFL